MQIFIRTLSGTTITLEVEPTDTIISLKQAICVREGISPADQRLIWACHQLEDDETVQYYSIKENSTLDLTGRLRGGIPITDCTDCYNGYVDCHNGCMGCYTWVLTVCEGLFTGKKNEK